MKKAFPFTIGADPELNILSQGKRVDCFYTMKNLLNNDSNFSENKGLRAGRHGYFGWDGCSSTAELRPNPADSPEALTNNIGELFKAFVKRISIFDFSTLSFHASVGGHIHLQLPDKSTSDAKVKNMHKIMASYFIPAMMGENKINVNLRNRLSYGKIGDYHGDNYFGEGDDRVRTYEFRVPTAEWITTPKICNATLAYVATIWNEILNHRDNINMDIVYKNEKQGSALQDLLISEYTSLTKNVFKDIKKSIKSFEYYPIYQEEIDYIFDVEQVLKDKKKANYNIIDGWNLLPESKFNKRDLVNKKVFTAKALEKDLDNISAFFPITYNADPNCEIFASDLARRAAAFNWKLKKHYFLFGLRKGINNFLVKDWNNHMLGDTSIIQTAGDCSAILDIFRKMRERFSRISNNKKPIRLNFQTGTLETDDNVIFVGLPYEIRMKQNTNSFIKLIYDIEEDKLEKKGNFTFPEDTVEKGAIWELINKPQEPEVVMAKENNAVNEAVEQVMADHLENARIAASGYYPGQIITNQSV